MKYGLIYYKNTYNLGDDIQTYAALQFLPKVDYLIDRESLFKFIPDKKEYVKVIANGWYLDNKHTFPFSPYIYPLLISMHFTERDIIMHQGYEFLKGYAKKSLKKYFPIGCRDENTHELLQKLGYDSYFSGCMTLTINKIKEKTKNKSQYICAVDLNSKCLTYLKENTNIEIIETTHNVTEEYHELSFDERMEKVKKQLLLYQNAKLVVTDRLHVALPCMALGTPVALIYYKCNEDRLKTYTKYLNTFTEEEFLNMDTKVLLKLKNFDKYKELRDNLTKKCKKFISEKEEYNLDDLPELSTYKNEVEHVEYVSNLFLSSIRNLNKENEQLIDKVNKLQEKLDVINNSRSWKIVRRVINLKKKL